MSTLPGVDPSKINLTKTTKPRERVDKEKLVFGQTFTDHMLTVDWHRDSGWAAPQITPYGPMSVDPAASVFHYALECFEGMKAYKCNDGEVRLFRPDCNMERCVAVAE
jgi:branched-chain amino acid aminotransferase